MKVNLNGIENYSSMKIYKLAETKEYLLENGLLYDDEGDEVFSVRELYKYNVPLFKSHEDANAFLEQLEKSSGKKFGRVPSVDLLKTLRYKDTRKEKQEAEREWLNEREKRWQKGKF